jgi:hypothetical protein
MLALEVNTRGDTEGKRADGPETSTIVIASQAHSSCNPHNSCSIGQGARLKFSILYVINPDEIYIAAYSCT